MKQYNNISLVHKSLSGGLTKEEKVAYNEWLIQPGNNKLAQDLEDIWNLSSAYEPTSFKPNASAAFHKFKSQIKQETVVAEPKIVRMKPMLWVTRIAASLLLVAACLFLFNNNNKVNFQEAIYASAMTNSDLNDGTQVWLKENASMALTTDFNENERRIKLEGKAHFKVQRDESKPFIIEMGKNRLEVLGTSFNVDNSTEDVIVEVESGIVKVSTKNQETILKAGDKAIMNYEKDQISISKSSAADFAWFQSSLNIKAMSIEKAMNKIASFYDVKVDLSVNVDRACKLTSPLADNSSVDELFEVLESTYQMKYEKINSKHFEVKYLNCK